MAADQKQMVFLKSKRKQKKQMVFLKSKITLILFLLLILYLFLKKRVKRKACAFPHPQGRMWQIIAKKKDSVILM